ncbi:MAG: PAS domain S-box protein [Anaerolineae bacterium]|nr:PAS domain S-box protein [Anaerolineae bacterium]
MPDNMQDLSMELAKAREQFEMAQLRVASLEAQLSGDHPDSPTMPPDGDRDYRTFDHLLEGCQIIDFDWHYRYVNETAARHGLRAKDELIGHTMMELYPGIEQTEMFTALQRCMQERTVERIENEFIYPDGTSAWFDLSIQPVPEGIFILSLDITERTRTLEEIEILARFPSENPNPVLRIASDGSLLYANPGSHHLLTLWGCEVGTRLPEDVRRVVSESFAAGTSREIEVICDNTIYSLDIAPVVDAVYANVYGRDITKRTRAEINIRKLNRTLSMLSDINQAIVRIRHLPTLFETACQIAVEKGGFRMAWIGLLDEAAGRVTPVAHAGIAQEYLNNLNIVLNEERNGEGAIALALLKGEHIVVNDVEHDSIVIRSRDEALRLGYLAMAAFPLKVAGEARAAFGLYATETDFFDDDELRMLDEIAGDIAFAMEFAEQEAQREQVEIALERHAQRLEILHEIDIGIINADSIQKVVETALRNIRRLIPCQRANVGLIDHEKGEGVIFALALDGDTKLGQGLRVPLQAGLLEGYDTRHLKVVEDLRSLQESNPRFKQGVNEGLLSALNVLLMDRDQPIGTLGLFANTTGFFTEEYQEITIQIASQLAIAIRQMRLSEALQRHAAELEERVEERTADLTEVKERVEAILNNSLDGILLVHPDLSIQQTNVSFNHLFGCDQDDYFGKSLVMLIHAQDADTVDRLVQGVFQEQQGKRAEIRAIRKDGGVFEAELSVGFIKGDGMACAFHDITERKQAEEALRQSTVEIQDLYNNAPCGYHSIDRDGVIVQINDTELRWMGYTREELVGKLKITDIFTPESVQAFQENFPRFKERGWVNDLEFDVVCKDGSIMHILLNGTAIYDEGGQYLKSRSTLFDMTDLKRTQQALADSEARYRQMFERNQAIKLLIDPQTGAIVDANPAACAYFMATILTHSER